MTRSTDKDATSHYSAIKAELSVQPSWTRLHGQNSETLSMLYVVDQQSVLTADIEVEEVLAGSS